MAHLYHGSGYKQPELKPGFLHSGVLVEWDKTESNKWIYAAVLMEDAIAQGLASVIEKSYKLARYQSVGNKITMTFDGPAPKQKDIEALTVYLYTIDWDESIWTKVNNPHNGMDNEFKTEKTIVASMIDSCEKVDIKHWLSRKEVVIRAKSASMNW